MSHAQSSGIVRRFTAVGAGALLALGCLKAPERPIVSELDVKRNPPANFELDGQPFCFGGSNNYYPIYKPRAVVDDLFQAAKKLNMRVLRVWGMLDRGSLDGSVPNTDPGGGDKQGVYFQYWDPVKRAPAYNDGPDGLQRLDYVLAKAGELDLKLILVLVNNWREFGGIAQYLTWYGRDKHHEFFTEPELKQAYKNWVEHVVTRINTITGVAYRDDPTIFSWELANEPRCKGGSSFDHGTGWTKSTITDWAAEMSSYIKSLDPNHMVSVGDEGFLNTGGEHWAYQATDGVDHAALTALPAVDFGTFHLYPEDWGVGLEWGEQWIFDHLKVARELGKPTVLEEYGVKVRRSADRRGAVVAGWPEREQAYRRWNETLFQNGGNGFLPWMLAGIDDDGSPYPDYDRYGFYADDATGRLIGEDSRRFLTAPACQSAQAAGARSEPSPFVRARKRPTPVALGWVETRG